MKNSVHFFLILLLIASTAACKKDTDNIPSNDGTIDDLQIPDGFTFETSKTVQFSLLLPTSVVLNTNSHRADVYDALPSEGGRLLYSSSFPASGRLDIDMKVPAALTSLYVNTFAGTAIIDLNTANGSKDGGIVIDFGDGIGFEPPQIAADEKSGIFQNRAEETANFKTVRSIVNLIENGDFSTNDFGSINDWPSPMIADGRWYITSTLGSNHAQQNQQAGEKYLRITKSPARYGGVAQLVAANPGDLITITSDIRITGNANNISWLYLISRDASGNATGYFNIERSGNNNQWITRTLAATMPAGTVSVQALLWNHIYGGAIDYDNVIVTGPVSDSDGDGVDDELDDYPNDSDRAFDVFYPNNEDFGTLAFEDLWPGKGDYDFNDLVIDYQFKQVLNGNNKMVEIFMDYQVRAIGASLTNGFGIEIPGTISADIASVSGTNYTESYINLNTNGTEQSQENAVVILFDNAFSMIDSPVGGFGVNVSPEAPYVEPVMRQLTILFENPVSIQQTGFAPFNPFLIVDKTRGREVHLPGKTPTSLHDESYFGQWFDDSNPTTGKYYQSASNLPWAIDLPVAFDYPIEKVEVTDAYLKFADWAESGGLLYPDWYEQESGYRNQSLIYAQPN